MTKKTSQQLSPQEELQAIYCSRKTLDLLTRENKRISITIEEVGMDTIFAWTERISEKKAVSLKEIAIAVIATEDDTNPLDIYESLSPRSQLQLHKEGNALVAPLWQEALAMIEEMARAQGYDPEKEATTRMAIEQMMGPVLEACLTDLRKELSAGSASSTPSPETDTPSSNPEGGPSR